MDEMGTLRYAVDELRREIVSLDDSQMDTATNCEPWTVRQLASHALNNQLLWAGAVTGEETVSVEETMGAVPHEGDLARFAAEVADRSLAMWQTEGILDRHHATPFGELPGSVVIMFPTIDAICHAWDLAASLGHPIEFSPDRLPAISAIVDAVCTDEVRGLGLIKAATEPPPDASETERLMALAGRTIPR